MATICASISSTLLLLLLIGLILSSTTAISTKGTTQKDNSNLPTSQPQRNSSSTSSSSSSSSFELQPTSDEVISDLSHYSDIHISSIRKVQDELVEISWTVNITDNNNNNNNNNNSNNGGTAHQPTSTHNFSNFVISYAITNQNNNNNNINTSPPSPSTPTSPTTTITDQGLEFRSSPISPDIRSIHLHLPFSRHIKICIEGEGRDVTNATTKKSCSDWSNPDSHDTNNKDDNDDDDEEEKGTDIKKLIAGISAGCVFLVPCLALLIVIMRKDKQMNKMSSVYEELGSEHLNPGLDLGDEEKAVLKRNVHGEEVEEQEGKENEMRREVSGSERKGQEKMMRRLSASKLRRDSAAPTIIIHSVDGDSDSDNDGFYTERL